MDVNSYSSYYHIIRFQSHFVEPRLKMVEVLFRKMDREQWAPGSENLTEHLHVGHRFPSAMALRHHRPVRADRWAALRQHEVPRALHRGSTDGARASA